MEKIQNTLEENFNPNLIHDLNAINKHLHLMKIANIWDYLIPKKKDNQEEMQEEKNDISSEPKDLKYISNILKILKKEKFNLTGIKANKLDQIYDGIYEGGKRSTI